MLNSCIILLHNYPEACLSTVFSLGVATNFRSDELQVFTAKRCRRRKDAAGTWRLTTRVLTA